MWEISTPQAPTSYSTIGDNWLHLNGEPSRYSDPPLYLVSKRPGTGLATQVLLHMHGEVWWCSSCIISTSIHKFVHQQSPQIVMESYHVISAMSQLRASKLKQSGTVWQQQTVCVAHACEQSSVGCYPDYFWAVWHIQWCMLILKQNPANSEAHILHEPWLFPL